ncbi:MAG: hypothetical protein AAFO69_10635 [Bacteroidota bacterium]
MGFEWIPPDQYYKKHFICLKCQKGFKRASDLEIKDLLKAKEATCPQCGTPMTQVDYNFEVPSTNKDKQWKKLRQQYENR